MKKSFKVSVITVFTAAISSIGLISLGFASWTINQNDSAQVDGGIISDTLISLTGFRVKSVTTFDYGVYSYGNTTEFTNTGDITYHIGITPSQFDPDTLSKLSSGPMTIYGKFNSFYEVFETSNSSYVNFVGSTWDHSSVNEIDSNGNNYLFSFAVSGIADLSSNVEITKDLTFTFNNKILVKQFGNNETIANNKFTLSLGKEGFSL